MGHWHGTRRDVGEWYHDVRMCATEEGTAGTCEWGRRRGYVGGGHNSSLKIGCPSRMYFQPGLLPIMMASRVVGLAKGMGLGQMMPGEH